MFEKEKGEGEFWAEEMAGTQTSRGINSEAREWCWGPGPREEDARATGMGKLCSLE